MVDLAEFTAHARRLVPIVAQMDLEVIEGGGTTAAARIPAGPNGNHFGAVYAGSLFTVAEVLGGVFGQTTLALDGFVPLVKRVEIDFRRPATSDVVARAEMTAAEVDRVRAEAQEKGKAEYVLEAVLTGEDGTVVATTRAVYQLRRF